MTVTTEPPAQPSVESATADPGSIDERAAELFASPAGQDLATLAAAVFWLLELPVTIVWLRSRGDHREVDGPPRGPPGRRGGRQRAAAGADDWLNGHGCCCPRAAADRGMLLAARRGSSLVRLHAVTPLLPGLRRIARLH